MDVNVQNNYIAPLKIRAIVLGVNGSVIVGKLANFRIFDGIIVIEIESTSGSSTIARRRRTCTRGSRIGRSLSWPSPARTPIESREKTTSLDGIIDYLVEDRATGHKVFVVIAKITTARRVVGNQGTHSSEDVVRK